jgi:hypothetical protein
MNIGVEKWVFYVNKVIIKHFIKFLETNNALDSYLANLNKKENTFKESNLFKCDAPSNIVLYFGAPKLIAYAFDWSKTMEGCVYWAELSMEWSRLHSEILKNFLLIHELH